MKSLSLKFLAAAFFLTTAGVVGIDAQPLPSNGVEFKTAFPFVIGTQNLPAGEYTIKPTQEDIDMLIISTPSGRSIYAYCDEIDLNSAPAKTEITFRKYGSGTTRFLRQITVGGATQGCSFATSASEKKAKKSGSPSKEAIDGKSK